MKGGHFFRLTVMIFLAFLFVDSLRTLASLIGEIRCFLAGEFSFISFEADSFNFSAS